MKLKPADKKYVNNIKVVIEEETYDDIEEDVWDIVETLIKIIEQYTEV